MVDLNGASSSAPRREVEIANSLVYSDRIRPLTLISKLMDNCSKYVKIKYFFSSVRFDWRRLETDQCRSHRDNAIAEEFFLIFENTKEVDIHFVLCPY